MDSKKEDKIDEKKAEDVVVSGGDVKPAAAEKSTKSDEKVDEPVSEGGEKTKNAKQEKAVVADPDKSSEKGSSKDAEDDLIELEDHDDYLMYLEDILKTVHKAYYELYDQVAKSLLSMAFQIMLRMLQYRIETKDGLEAYVSRLQLGNDF